MEENIIDNKLIQHAEFQTNEFTYLNTSSSGLISKAGIENAQNFNQKLHLLGSKQAEDFYINEIPKVRQTISEFIGASKDEIALIPNFSYGLNALIPSLSKLKRVLLFKDDYPSLILPFTLNDFEVFWVKSKDGFAIELDDIVQSITKNKIEVLAISQIQYLTGFCVDLDQLVNICKSYDVLLIVDGTQSLGAVPFSFRSSGVNIFITSNYKWMNAGYGTGIMCIDQETLTKYPPKIGGFNSYKYIDDEWDYATSINSYEPGHLNMAGLSVLKDAIEYKMKLGVDNICLHNAYLLQRITDKLASTKYKVVGPIGNQNRRNIIGIHGDKSLEDYLYNQGVIVKMRDQIIRVGIHLYNNEQDIDHLIACLEHY